MLRNITPELSIGNLNAFESDLWSALNINLQDAAGQITKVISMINPMIFVGDFQPENLDFTPFLTLKSFKFSINEVTGDTHVSVRGRDIPRAFFRTEKIRSDEKDHLFEYFLAEYLSRRDQSYIKRAHTKRWNIPKQLRLDKDTRRNIRRILKHLHAIATAKRKRELLEKSQPKTPISISSDRRSTVYT